MLCPIDQTPLVIADRQGIEIDYCPKCRGVWLDRGELDKLIERSQEFSGAEPAHQTHREDPRYDERQKHDSDDEHHGYHHKKKRESFLGDLFDF